MIWTRTRCSKRVAGTLSLGIFAALIGGAPAFGGTIMTQPSGLTPGTQYQLVFVTSDGFLASSTNVSTYNTDVTTEAALNTTLASFDAANGVAWTVIGTVPGVNANANAPSSGLVYTLDGTQVASSANSLYSGSLLAAVDINQYGNTENTSVWTGSSSNGANTNPFYELGGTFPVEGYSTSTSSTWLNGTNGIEAANDLPLYALSSVITVPSSSAVPEPSTLAFLAMAMLLLPAICRRAAESQNIHNGTER